MTEQRQRLTIRAELARRMGWTLEADGYWQSWRSLDGSTRRNVRPSYDESPIGDPFTNAADKDALVEWLAKQSSEVQQEFEMILMSDLATKENCKLPVVLFWLTASYEAITLAACKALGIGETGE